MDSGPPGTGFQPFLRFWPDEFFVKLIDAEGVSTLLEILGTGDVELVAASVASCFNPS